MTPFSVMETASENLTLEEYFENTDQFTFSRIPIYENNKENIIGYVLKDKILEEIINQNTNATLASISRKFIVFTTESKIPYVFDKLIKEREHISLIIDKKKEVKGIVTMEDIIETLLGYEIMDETDTIEDMQAYAKKRMQNMNL
jgi:CBS domain containing-hemolysin-like protein